MAKKLPELRRTQRPEAGPGDEQRPGAKVSREAATGPRGGRKRASKAAEGEAAARTGASRNDSRRAGNHRGEANQTTGARQTMTTAQKEKDASGEEAQLAARGDALLRRHQANAIVSKYSAWSSAFGLLPIPYADVAGISGTQVTMVTSLSRLYDVPFSENWIRTILGAIVGGIAPWAVTSGVVSTLFKSMPGVGLAVGIAGMAGLANLATRTIGNLFIEHFEAGGDLSNVDTDAMRKAFEQALRRQKH